MNELEQVWRKRIDWVQASGLTVAEASAQHGLSVASVYRWKKLMAESPVPERHPAGPEKRPAGATIGRSIRQGPPIHSIPAAAFSGLFCQTAS